VGGLFDHRGHRGTQRKTKIPGRPGFLSFYGPEPPRLLRCCLFASSAFFAVYSGMAIVLMVLSPLRLCVLASLRFIPAPPQIVAASRVQCRCHHARWQVSFIERIAFWAGPWQVPGLNANPPGRKDARVLGRGPVLRGRGPKRSEWRTVMVRVRGAQLLDGPHALA